MVMSAKPGWRLRMSVAPSTPLRPEYRQLGAQHNHRAAGIPKGLDARIVGEDSAVFAHQFPPIGSQSGVVQLRENRGQAGICPHLNFHLPGGVLWLCL
jgi:hypothetical protein